MSSPAQLQQAVPVVPVRDVAHAVAFYRDRLGFTVRHQQPGLAIVTRGGVDLHLTELADESWRTRADLAARPVTSGAESFIPGTAACRVQVDDGDALFAEYQATGALHPRSAQRDQPWGDRDFALTDPDGNLLTFFQRAATAGRP